jgi:hypothetical protein
VSGQLASVYMRLAKNSDKVEKAAEENGSGAADLSMRAMLKLLKKPKTDEQKAKAKQPKTTTNPKAAIEPSETKRDEEVGKEWLKELAADELVAVLREFRDDQYLRQLSAALAKVLRPPIQAAAPTAGIAGVGRVITPQPLKPA